MSWHHNCGPLAAAHNERALRQILLGRRMLLLLLLLRGISRGRRFHGRWLLEPSANGRQQGLLLLLLLCRRVSRLLSRQCSCRRCRWLLLGRSRHSGRTLLPVLPCLHNGTE